MQVLGYQYILGILFPMQNPNNALLQPDVAQKFKEAALTASEHMKEQIYSASPFNVNQN
jgi:hypothetical protein